MQYPIVIPKLVEKTKEFATSLGFDNRREGNRAGRNQCGPSSCIDEVGSLLRILASSLPEANIGEIGTGAGVGTAWLVSGARPDSKVVSVEIDQSLGRAVGGHFAGIGNLEILVGDWRGAFSQKAPFDLLFFDGGGTDVEAKELAELTEVGGLVVVDDLTPEELWPADWKGLPDPKRELAFKSGYFNSHETLVRKDVSALLMVRV